MKDKPKKKKIVAVIPAYNEKEHIAKVVKETKKYVDKVIVVDDASTDKTGELAKKAGAIVLRHEINLQKGATLRTGCEVAIMFNADSIITLDGDGQHDPHEIPKLIRKLDKYNLVIGSREFNKNMPLTAKIGNFFLSKLSQVLFKNKIKDSQTGYRAFNTKIYPKILWKSSGYGIETEMIRNINRHNLSHIEVDVQTIYNDDYKGTTPLDGIKIALNMLQWRVKQ